MRDLDNHASPGNPVMQTLREVTGEDDHLIALGHWMWCPGCQQVHRPRSRPKEPFTEDGIYWEWDGNETAPTFSPSLLVYHTVHLCGRDVKHYEVCTDPQCPRIGHYLPEPGVRAHGLPCPRGEWGNCHSFIRNGQWEFLSDCAHELAGQTVPMVPLPDWLVRR